MWLQSWTLGVASKQGGTPLRLLPVSQRDIHFPATARGHREICYKLLKLTPLSQDDLHLTSITLGPSYDPENENQLAI